MYFLAQFAEQLTLHMDVAKLENLTYKSFLCVFVCMSLQSQDFWF